MTLRDVIFLIWIGSLMCVLSGCGEETPTAATGSSQEQEPLRDTGRQNSLTSEYHDLCIDDHLPAIAQLKTECDDFNTQFGFHLDCVGRAALLTLQLNHKWTEILAGAAANLTACRADWRTSEDYCLAQYDLDFTHRIFECQSVVNTTLLY